MLKLKHHFFNFIAYCLYAILISGAYMWGNEVISFLHGAGLAGALKLSFHHLFVFIFWSITSLFLMMHFILTIYHNFTFDAIGGMFLKSRRLFKNFLIENDSRVTKTRLIRVPFMRFGSQANPFFRALTYAGAVLAYDRYRKIKFKLFNDVEKSKLSYMQTSKAQNIEKNNPIVNELMFDPRFQARVTLIHRVLSKALVSVGVVWTICFVCWLILAFI